MKVIWQAVLDEMKVMVQAVLEINESGWASGSPYK